MRHTERKEQNRQTVPVSVHLISTQRDTGTETLFSELVTALADERYTGSIDFSSFPAESFEVLSQGELTREDGRVTLSYRETELTGMEGAVTTLSYAEDAPGIVTMLRYGAVSTALVFEKGRRHRSAYETGVMPFEICTYATRVQNGLTPRGGRLELDYLIEIRGATAEHTQLTVDIKALQKDGTVRPSAGKAAERTGQ